MRRILIRRLGEEECEGKGGNLMFYICQNGDAINLDKLVKLYTEHYEPGDEVPYNSSLLQGRKILHDTFEVWADLGTEYDTGLEIFYSEKAAREFVKCLTSKVGEIIEDTRD